MLNLFRKQSLVRFRTFGAMKSTGNGDLDHSGLVKLVEELPKAEFTNVGLVGLTSFSRLD